MLSLNRQNQYRERYRQATPGWRPATEVYEGLIRDQLRPTLRAVDLGCGRGGVLEQLGGLIDFPIGFDPDGDSLVEHRLPTLPRAVALAESIPLPAASVDAVFCSWVLEHLAYPERVFGEVSRCLRPGGAFVFLTPNKEAVVTRLNQALKPLQSQLVPRLYGRAESDTFPVVYRANTLPDLKMLAQKADLMLETCLGIPDPTYLAFHPLLYRIGVWLTQRTPPVHWVGVCRKIH